MLIDNKISAQKTKQSATKLWRALAKHNLIRKTPNLKNWSNEFRLLQSTKKEEKVNQVLIWYISNLKHFQSIGFRFIPQIFSARSFRLKFDKLETLMMKDASHPLQHKRSSPKQKRDPRITKLKREILKLPWPLYDFENTLTPLITKSFQSCLDLRRKLLKDKSDMKYFSIHVVNKIGDPAAYIEQWFRNVHNHVSSYQSYYGNISSFEFSQNHKIFLNQLVQWYMQYYGNLNGMTGYLTWIKG